jgi:hypothetical protein
LRQQTDQHDIASNQRQPFALAFCTVSRQQQIAILTGNRRFMTRSAWSGEIIAKPV